MVKISIVHLLKDADQNQYNDSYLWGPKSELWGCHLFQWILILLSSHTTENFLKTTHLPSSDYIVSVLLTTIYTSTELCCCCSLIKHEVLQSLCSRVSVGDSGVVGRSWRYCNARPTRDGAGASSWTISPYKNQFNIEGGTCPPYQILSW